MSCFPVTSARPRTWDEAGIYVTTIASKAKIESSDINIGSSMASIGLRKSSQTLGYTISHNLACGIGGHTLTSLGLLGPGSLSITFSQKSSSISLSTCSA